MMAKFSSPTDILLLAAATLFFSATTAAAARDVIVSGTKFSCVLTTPRSAPQCWGQLYGVWYQTANNYAGANTPNNFGSNTGANLANATIVQLSAATNTFVVHAY